MCSGGKSSIVQPLPCLRPFLGAHENLLKLLPDFGNKCGDRDSSIQENFRNSLIEKYDVGHPDPSRTALWCAVTKRWVDVENATATHIFAYENGADMMDAIFGRESPDSELFFPLNGLLLSNSANTRFAMGQFVIGPALDEDATEHQITQWHEMPAKPYRIRVVDTEAPNMKTFVSPESSKLWSDLDGEAVEFRNEYRPRARYLYFHLVCSMLRRAWNKNEKEKALTDQLGKKFWGTPRPYMQRTMLQAGNLETQSLRAGSVQPDE